MTEDVPMCGNRVLVRDINAAQADKKNIVAYSIDAGFHVFLFCMKEHYETVRGQVLTN